MKDFVVVIRLLSGEDVVAVIVDETEHTVEVENPFVVSYSASAGGAVFKPYCLFTDDHNFRFKNESIITISNASETVSQYYLELNEQYNEYIDKKHTVNDLKKLLDEIGLDQIEPDLDDDLFDLEGKISLVGNDTKH